MLWLFKNWQLVLVAFVAAAIYTGVIYATGRSAGVDSERNKQAEAIKIATRDAREKEDKQADAGRAIDVDVNADRQALNAARGRVRQLERDLRIALRAEPKRVCIDTGSRVPEAANPTSEPDGATGGDGPSPGAERDIAGDLAQFAQRCETDRLSVQGWQRWSEAMRGLN